LLFWWQPSNFGLAVNPTQLAIIKDNKIIAKAFLLTFFLALVASLRKTKTTF
jgi:hypothetical protein